MTASIVCRALPLVLLGFATPAGEAPPGAALPRSTPSSKGVSAAGLLDFLRAVEDSHLGLHSLMLARGGHVVAEGWWAPYRPALRHTLYSLSKSFTSTAVGLAVAEGKIRLEDRVVKLFPDELPPEVSPNLAAIRVRDLLRMGAGHQGDSLFGAGFSVDSPGWVRSVLARPVEHAPGTHFAYNNGCTFLLSALVQKATGQTLPVYLTPRLFEPLGIVGADWEINPDGIADGAWGLRVRTEDILKLGLLYLGKGVWNGRRILTEEWVNEATGSQIENAPPADPARAKTSDWAQGYGFQFWRSRHGAYRGDGAFGQYCVVFPEKGAVLAITAETGDMQAVLNAVWEHVLPALGEETTQTPDAGAEEALRKKLASLALDPPAGERSVPLAAKLGRVAYTFPANKLQVEGLSLQFGEDRCEVTLKDAGGEHHLVCGLGAWVEGQTTASPRPLYLATTGIPGPHHFAGAGAWKDERTFVMHWRFTETPHHEVVTCRFEADELTLERRRSIFILNPATPDPQPAIVGKRM